MSDQRFDVCVIGAGPAGYAAAMRAHDLGRRVLLVERGRVGGAGIHEGALSSKTLWHLANDYATASRVDRGYRAGALSVSYPDVMATVRRAVDECRGHLERQLERLAAPLPSGAQVVTARGTGRFVGPHAIEVSATDGSVTRYEAGHFIVATGSRPRALDGVTVDGRVVVTSDHIESWDRFPESMVIVGAGVVGCEYATVFAHFGRTRIHIIDRQPRILPFEDDDVAACVARSFERMGVVIHREAKLRSLRAVGDHVEYEIESPKGRETIAVERALISIGRVPNTGDLGLEAAGVALGRGGCIEATRSVTSVPHIHAVGDLTADVALVNVGEMEGRQAAEIACGLPASDIHYEALSAIMFLEPEVASVGLNEMQARQKGIPYRAAVLSGRLINRCVAMRSTDGFVKLLASPEPPYRVLGLRVVGPEASSCIQGIAFLIDHGATLEDIDRCVHPHPAITEGVQECARILLGRSMRKTSVFEEALLRCVDG